MTLNTLREKNKIKVQSSNNSIYKDSSFTIEKYDYNTFKKIAVSDVFVDEFKNKVWDTYSKQHLKIDEKSELLKLFKGALKFDYDKPFEF